MDWSTVPGIIAIIGLIITIIRMGKWSGKLETKVDALWDIFMAEARERVRQHMRSDLDTKTNDTIKDALRDTNIEKLHCLSKKSEAEVTMKLYRELDKDVLMKVASKLDVTISGALYLIAKYCREQQEEAIAS